MRPVVVFAFFKINQQPAPNKINFIILCRPHVFVSALFYSCLFPNVKKNKLSDNPLSLFCVSTSFQLVWLCVALQMPPTLSSSLYELSCSTFFFYLNFYTFILSILRLFAQSQQCKNKVRSETVDCSSSIRKIKFSAPLIEVTRTVFNSQSSRKKICFFIYSLSPTIRPL